MYGVRHETLQAMTELEKAVVDHDGVSGLYASECANPHFSPDVISQLAIARRNADARLIHHAKQLLTHLRQERFDSVTDIPPSVN